MPPIPIMEGSVLAEFWVGYGGYPVDNYAPPPIPIGTRHLSLHVSDCGLTFFRRSFAGQAVLANRLYVTVCI